MRSRTWRRDFWGRSGISERIGKPGPVAALRNLGAASPSSGATIPCPCGSAKKYKCGCDGELRVLTDAFRAQDFATEAAIHAGKVTGLGAGEADGSRHVTGAPNSSTPGSYCEKQLHPSSLSSHVLSSTWQLRWFLVVDARKRPLAAATLH